MAAPSLDRHTFPSPLLESPGAILSTEVIDTIALIPAFNEERFIGSLVLAAQKYVDQVLVIDDGSADQTAEIARRAGAIVVQHHQNQGKAAAVNTGFRHLRRLRPLAAVMLDGDGQHRAEDIPQLLAPILDGEADLVIGSRFMGVKSDIPAYRKVGQHSLTLATNLASGVMISDSQSGYRAFSRDALDRLSFGQQGFSVESEMQFLAREHKLRVAEVPIQVLYTEPAKRNPVSHGMQVVHGIVSLVGQGRPLLFFSLLALPLLLFGGLLGLYVIEIYIRTRQLAIGYALITVFASEVGTILFFTGLILHSTRGMITDLRRHFQERLQR